MRYVIIGSSAAGLFAAERIRRNDAAGQIDILTEESYPAYARCMTSEYLTGSYKPVELSLRTEDFYRNHGLNLHRGDACVAVEPGAQQVRTASSKVYPYDKLLIASGATAVLPEIEGNRAEGVFTLRFMDDALAIDGMAATAKRAVVLGGGFVSLKAAYALMKRGLKVSCVVTAQHILGQVLSADDGDALAVHLVKRGLDILYGNDAVEIVPDANGKVKSVVLRDGRELPADLVIIGKGVTPKTSFLEGSGIAMDGAIKTDGCLRTSVENIYAAGDCIESYDPVAKEQRRNTLWPNATEQGQVAGDNMSGVHHVYAGSMAMNAATFYEHTLIGAGFAKRGEEDGFEVVKWSKGDSIRRRLVFEGDVIKGFYLMGDVSKAGILTQLMKNQTPLGRARNELERGNFSSLVRFLK